MEFLQKRIIRSGSIKILIFFELSHFYIIRTSLLSFNKFSATFSLNKKIAERSNQHNHPGLRSPLLLLCNTNCFLYFNLLIHTTKEGNCRCAQRFYISGKTFL